MHIYIYIVYFSYAIIINFFCFFINPGRDRSLLSLERLENMVRYYRRKDFSDWEAQLFAPGLSRVGGDDDRNFVRFNLKMPIDGDLVQVVSYYLYTYIIRLTRIPLSSPQLIGFAHPGLLHELGDYALHGFADCTFAVVPSYCKCAVCKSMQGIIAQLMEQSRMRESYMYIR